MNIKCSERAPELACSYRIARTTLPFLSFPLLFLFLFLFSCVRETIDAASIDAVSTRKRFAQSTEKCVPMFSDAVELRVEKQT